MGSSNSGVYSIPDPLVIPGVRSKIDKDFNLWSDSTWYQILYCFILLNHFQLHTYIYIYIYIYVCMYIYIYIYIYMCVCVCVCVCVFIYIYIYIYIGLYI